MEGFMLDALWAFFFGGQVEQQVVVVNSATLQTPTTTDAAFTLKPTARCQQASKLRISSKTARL
jgi:hypothetical protein